MPTVIMVKTMTKDGLSYYSPIDAESEKNLNSQDTIAFELKGFKAQRSLAQNAGIRLYCKWLCEALNNAGLDMVEVFKRISKTGVIPWSPETVLERLWRPTQKHTYNTNSTTELNTEEVGIVYEALNCVTGDKLGVSMNFPDKYLKLYDEENKIKKV